MTLKLTHGRRSVIWLHGGLVLAAPFWTACCLRWVVLMVPIDWAAWSATTLREMSGELLLPWIPCVVVQVIVCIVTCLLDCLSVCLSALSACLLDCLAGLSCYFKVVLPSTWGGQWDWRIVSIKSCLADCTPFFVVGGSMKLVCTSDCPL